MLEIGLHRVEILRRAAEHASHAPLPAGIDMVERGVGDLSRILADSGAHGERRHADRLASRFEHGLRHFILEHDGRSVAWTWLAAGVPRYLDELCWSVPMTADQAWVRDAFVVPTHRGRRLLGGLLDAATQHLGGPIEYFSDIDSANRRSLRAHAAAGFVRCASVVGVQAFSLCLRPRPPLALPPVHALRPSRRVLWLDREEREWHCRHIA